MHNESTTLDFKHFAVNVYKSSELLHPHLSWIVDSGATDHIFSNKSIFSSLSKLPHTQFIVLNGNDTTISFVGNLTLHASLILENVLYVPSFKYNFVSIPRITSQLQTFAIFNDND